MVRFSVLLPTRNGGHLLRDCIASVLDQPYDDLELVVSDNASAEETVAVIRSFASDPRLRSIRLEEPVSVTENWRAALEASQGDYILLIGDDDCLLPGYFHRMERILERYNQPECVGYNAYYYVFPGSLGNRSSYYIDHIFELRSDFGEGFLSRETRTEIVRDQFQFRLRYPLGAQQTLIARCAADRIRGGMFQAPFPDFYAISALLLQAESVVYHPEKLVVVGVAPKSFHQFFLKAQQSEGMSYLGVNADFEGRLPGNEMLNAIHVWLEKLRQDYPTELGNLSIDRDAYVRRQAFFWVQQLRSGALSSRALLGRCRRLSLRDWLGLTLSPLDRSTRSHVREVVRRREVDPVRAIWPAAEPLEGIQDIRQFAAAVPLLE